jgi:hypothetical protein
MFSMVWLATCPMLSPVTRHLAPVAAAKRDAISIIAMRESTVVQASGAFSLIRSCTFVKGMVVSRTLMA